MFGLLGSSLRTLGAILGAALATLVNTEAVKSAADDMVAVSYTHLSATENSETVLTLEAAIRSPSTRRRARRRVLLFTFLL